MRCLAKQIMARVISQRAHGKKIIFRGEDKELEETLERDFHLSVEFFVTAVRERADDVRTFYISKVKNLADQYFMVMPTLSYTESEKRLMDAIGYVRKEDFLYLKHAPIAVNTKDLENYEDEYGNRIVCGGAAVSVTFSGWGSYVEIGKNCITPKLIIDVKDDATFKIGDKCIFRRENKVFLLHKATLIIEDNCSFLGSEFTIYEGAEMYIRENGTFGRNFMVRPARNSRVIIGRDCMASLDLFILGSDGHAIFDVTTGKRTNWQEDTLLEIGEHVWIGAGCTILPKVKIGSGSIIGAASVVTKSVPNNCIAVGSPAKVVRKNIAWSRNVVTQNIVDCPPEYVRLTEEDI